MQYIWCSPDQQEKLGGVLAIDELIDVKVWIFKISYIFNVAATFLMLPWLSSVPSHRAEAPFLAQIHQEIIFDNMGNNATGLTCCTWTRYPVETSAGPWRE